MSVDNKQTSLDGRIAKETASHLDDKEVETIVREALKRYVKHHLEIFRFKLSDKSSKAELANWTIPADVKDPVFASLLASYVGLISQEKQGKTNLILQILIALVAVASLVASIVSLFFRSS